MKAPFNTVGRQYHLYKEEFRNTSLSIFGNRIYFLGEEVMCVVTVIYRYE